MSAHKAAYILRLFRWHRGSDSFSFEDFNSSNKTGDTTIQRYEARTAVIVCIQYSHDHER